MEVKAKLRYLRISPRKVRLVIDAVRGKDAEEAISSLPFIQKRAAEPVLKLIKSALANAENNFQLKKENLFIKKITADEGPKLKRWKPRAFGRATPILKRSSHITLVLEEREPSKKKAKKKGKKEAKEELKVVKSEEIKEKIDTHGKEQDSDKKSFKPFSGIKGIKDKFSRKTGEK